MRRVLLALLSLGLVALFAAVSPTAAYACSCQGLSTRKALAESDTVFTGTVREIHRVGRGAGRRVDIRFEVSRVYKGTAYASQLVASGPESASCGLVPEVGSTWVIFAVDAIEGDGNAAVQRLRTSLCSGNLPTSTPPALLGRGSPARPGESDRVERAEQTDTRVTRGLATAGVVGVGVLVVVGGALLVLWRPSRRRL
jgi:hypothetical protein